MLEERWLARGAEQQAQPPRASAQDDAAHAAPDGADLVDEVLEETFPASDPPPGPTTLPKRLPRRPAR